MGNCSVAKRFFYMGALVSAPRFWVGRKDGIRTAFTYPGVPTSETHGNLYHGVTGPYKTRRGAEWAASHLWHSFTINQVEKIAKKGNLRDIRDVEKRSDLILLRHDGDILELQSETNTKKGAL